MRDWKAIAVRLRAEGLITLAEAGRLVPTASGHASAQTIRRWVLRGKGGARLEGVRLAGQGWFTSAAALDRFAAALSEVSSRGNAEEQARPAARGGPALACLIRL